jgi:hypothetical protein
MPATTITLYGSYGQKDVYFGRVLKKSASFVLASFRSSTYPRGYVSGLSLAAAFLDGLFEHPARIFDTHGRFAETATLDRHLGEIGGARATL